jgi:hypothetical protein
MCTYASKVDLPHPGSPNNSKETDLSLSGILLVSAMLKLLIRRMRSSSGTDQCPRIVELVKLGTITKGIINPFFSAFLGDISCS